MKIKIEQMDHLGKGIGFIDGKITFVSYGIPGDLLDITLVKENKKYNEGVINKIIEKSPDRIDSFCKYYTKCGGCNLQNLCYEKTLEYKKNRISNILNKIGINNDIKVIRNDNNLYYRNKIELKVVDGKVGYFENKSHNIIEIEKCMIAKNAINNFIKEINNMGIYNGDITLRCNFNDEVLVVINTLDDINLKDDYSNYKVVGIILNGKTVYGENHFLEKVNNLFFEVSYDSFFQVNSYINEKLFDIIKNNVKENTVLDLYSGVGTLSIISSTSAKKVYGIESIPNAVINAIKNAKINNKNNINFILGNVEDKIKFIDDHIDTVIFDPPRMGIKKEVFDKVLELKPNKIIYISCESMHLVDDLKLLKEYYDIKDISILDMFSYSYHTECVCVMERK